MSHFPSLPVPLPTVGLALITLVALAGGIFGLANPSRWASGAFEIDIDGESTGGSGSDDKKTDRRRADASATISFVRLAAARNVGSGIGLLVLLLTGQRRAAATVLMTGVSVAWLDAWACRQHGTAAAAAKARDHFFMGIFVAMLGYSLL